MHLPHVRVAFPLWGGWSNAEPKGLKVILRKSLIAASAAIVAIGLAACGSDDSPDSASSASSAPPTSVPAAASGPAPLVLQQQLELIADPAKAAPDKAAVIVDGTTRLVNLETLTKALANYSVTFAVSDVKTDGPITTAQVAVTSPHGAMPVSMTWKDVGGAWLLSKESACGLLAMGGAPCQ